MAIPVGLRQLLNIGGKCLRSEPVVRENAEDLDSGLSVSNVAFPVFFDNRKACSDQHPLSRGDTGVA